MSSKTSLTGRKLSVDDKKLLEEQCLNHGIAGLEETLNKWHNEGEERFNKSTLNDLLNLV